MRDASEIGIVHLRTQKSNAEVDCNIDVINVEVSRMTT